MADVLVVGHCARYFGAFDQIAQNHTNLDVLRSHVVPDIGQAHLGEDRDTRLQWLASHHTELNASRSAVLWHTHLADDEAYSSLLDIATESWTPVTMTMVG